MTKEILTKRNTDDVGERGKFKSLNTGKGWRFDNAERQAMTKAFTQVYAETEKLLGNHISNFKTIQQSGIMRNIPN